MARVVEVAAAVIFQSGRPGEGGAPSGLLHTREERFLLARRPPGKVYAGYWEFPGGKLEDGETVAEALARELKEELGMVVECASPWMVREFSYPHAHVRLHFWRVTAWQGELKALEHDALAWQGCGDTPSVDPLLPANAPILKALALPTVMAITHRAENGEDAELTRLQEGLASGLRLVQLRDKELPPAERAWFARTTQALVSQRKALLIVNDDLELARAIAADGVHLSAGSLRGCTVRPEFPWVGASCHDADELAAAVSLGLDYALLGPVLPTPTHAGAATLGWDGFAALARNSPLPVFALGGMHRDMLAQAQDAGAHGIALMRGW